MERGRRRQVEKREKRKNWREKEKRQDRRKYLLPLSRRMLIRPVILTLWSIGQVT